MELRNATAWDPAGRMVSTGRLCALEPGPTDRGTTGPPAPGSLRTGRLDPGPGRDVRVVSVTQQIDVSGTMGRMVAALLLGLAEIEWEYRRERQAAGMVVARRAGGLKGPEARDHQGQARPCRELRAKGLSAAGDRHGDGGPHPHGVSLPPGGR